MQLTTTPRRSKRNEHMLILAHSLIKALIMQHLHLRRRRPLLLRLHPRLLRNEPREAVKVASAIILLRLGALAVEPLERREPLHAVLLSQGLLRVGVDLGDLHLVAGVLEGDRQLLVYGRKILAVAAPRREEFDEGGLAALVDYLVEVFGDEVEDGGFGGCDGDEAAEQQGLEEHHGVVGVSMSEGDVELQINRGKKENN